MPAYRRRSALTTVCRAEPLESRRLFSGQIFPGQGPVTGDRTTRVFTADFTGDGRADLVTTSESGINGSNPVVLWPGQGDGTFGAAKVLLADGFGRTVAFADFNNDAKPDLALYMSGNITVLLGNGNGTFKTVTTSAAESFSGGRLYAGDFNGDGKTDLAGATGYIGIGNSTPASDRINVRLGNGDGTFAAVNTLAYPCAAVAVGDFNGDGRADLATGHYYNTTPTAITVLLSNGTGTFTATTPATASAAVQSLTARDFNGDGKVDLVANSTLLPGNGNGTFGTGVVLATNGQTSAADLNGDNKPDLLGGNYALINDGTTFTTVATSFSGYNGVTTDFNGDGKLDLAVAVVTRYMAAVYLGAGGGRFIDVDSSVRGSDTSSASRAVITGDFNNDGKADLASTNPGGNAVLVRAGNGDGTFSATATSVPLAAAPYGLATGDFNADGRLDLAATTGSGVSVLLNNGVSFGVATVNGAASSSNSIIAADLNGDALLDLALITPGKLAVILNTGGGTFDTPVSYAVPAIPRAVAAGDFNGDGKTDLVVTNRVEPQFTDVVGSLVLFLGVGDGTFAAAPAITGLTPYAASIAAADFNGDGRQDLAVTNVYNTLINFVGTTVSVLLGNGNGTFTANPTVLVSPDPNGLVLGDLNNDGRLDLITGGYHFASSNGQFEKYYGGAVTVNFGYGDGTFAPLLRVPTIDSSSLATADFNRDGKLDVVATNGSLGTLSVLLNQRDPNVSVNVLNGVLAVTGTFDPVAIAIADGVLSVDTPFGLRQVPLASVTSLVLNGVTAAVNSDLAGLGLTVNSTATATFSVSQHLAGLAVNGTATFPPGGRVLRTNALTIGTAGRLDLNDNSLIYDYAGIAPQADAVRALIAGGRANGAWTGNGLTSTAARTRADHKTTLGYMEASAYKTIYGAAATFAGEILDDTAVVVRYTLYGDADLDGRVAIADFNRLATHYAKPTGQSWLEGDFTYNAATAIDDFNLLAADFGLIL